MSLGYDPDANSEATADGTVGAERISTSQDDLGNTKTNTASGRGSVIGGDATAKSSASQGGSGSGGSSGGGGGGGGGGMGPISASLADSGTFGLGFSGDVANRGAFGDFNTNFGGTQTNGLSGKVLAIAGVGVAVVLLFLGRKG